MDFDLKPTLPTGKNEKDMIFTMNITTEMARVMLKSCENNRLPTYNSEIKFTLPNNITNEPKGPVMQTPKHFSRVAGNCTVQVR